MDKIYQFSKGMYNHFREGDYLIAIIIHFLVTTFYIFRRSHKKKPILSETDMRASKLMKKVKSAEEVVHILKLRGEIDPDYHYILIDIGEKKVRLYYYLGQTYRNTPSLFFLSSYGNDPSRFSQITSHLLLNEIDRVFFEDIIDTDLEVEYHNLTPNQDGSYSSSGRYKILDGVIVNFND